MSPNKIRLFWWSESKLMGKNKENYGDFLGKYLVERISNKKVEFTHPKKYCIKDFFQPIYVTAGSVLAHVNKKCIVWGSGIIHDNQTVKSAKFLAVRGPETRRVLVSQGYSVPKVYGDPALLLPDYFHPKVDKKYQLGIIPHYVDYEVVKKHYSHIKDVLVIDLMTDDIEGTTIEILKCKHIISSSLHGIIVAHAYQIPAIWIKFSNKLFGDDIKFKDYFKSVNINPYTPLTMEFLSKNKNSVDFFINDIALPNKTDVDTLKNDLMNACPFKINKRI